MEINRILEIETEAIIIWQWEDECCRRSYTVQDDVTCGEG